MKRLLTSAAILVALAVPAFAATSKSVSFPEPVAIGATQLPAGDYKVTWNGTGANVQVSFEQKGKGAAPSVVSAKVQDEAESHTGFTTSHVNNSNQLQVLQLGKTSLTFGAGQANGQ